MTLDSFTRELALKHNKLQCDIKSFLTGLFCSTLKGEHEGNKIHQDTIASVSKPRELSSANMGKMPYQAFTLRVFLSLEVTRSL